MVILRIAFSHLILAYLIPSLFARSSSHRRSKEFHRRSLIPPDGTLPVHSGTAPFSNGTLPSYNTTSSLDDGGIVLAISPQMQLSLGDSGWSEARLMIDTARPYSWIASSRLRCFGNLGFTSLDCGIVSSYTTPSPPKKVLFDADCRYGVGDTSIRGFCQKSMAAFLPTGQLIVTNGILATLTYSTAPLNETFRGSLGVLGLLPPTCMSGCDGLVSQLNFKKNSSIIHSPGWINLAANREGYGALRMVANSRLLEHVTQAPPEVIVPTICPSNPQDACSSAIMVDNIRIRVNASYELSPREYVIDSVLPYLLVPYDLAVAIAGTFPSWKSSTRRNAATMAYEQVFSVDCNMTRPAIPVVVTIGGQEFIISMKDMIVHGHPWNENECISAFQPLAMDNDTARLGWPFLYNVALTFDTNEGNGTTVAIKSRVKSGK
jgi:Eukaryotic aspartyl protease